MIKVAHENNIKTHKTAVVGEQRDTFSVLFISDVHNRKINKKMMDRLKRTQQIDFVVIGGDFCDGRTSIKKLNWNIDLLTRFSPVFFVWGNNDREIGEKMLRDVLQQKGIHIVENNAMLIEGRTNKTWLSAIDDYGTKNSNFEKALAKCEAEDVIICVSHNPQVFHLAFKYNRPSIFFGGHLHGGQIRFGPYGLHPNGSFSVRNGVPTLISNGYGTTLIPLRLGAHPEVHVVEIEVQPKQHK